MTKLLHGDYDTDGPFPISDSMIREAVGFRGWCRDYPSWHGFYGDTAEDYDKTPAHNAYHIQYLARTMVVESMWIGGPLVFLPCGGIIDGAHRWRALCFLVPTVKRIPPSRPYGMTPFRFANPYVPNPSDMVCQTHSLVCWRGLQCPTLQWGE